MQVLCVNVCTLTNAQVSAQEAGLCGPYARGGGGGGAIAASGGGKAFGAAGAKAKRGGRTNKAKGKGGGAKSKSGARHEKKEGGASLLSTIRDTLFKILSLTPDGDEMVVASKVSWCRKSHVVTRSYAQLRAVYSHVCKSTTSIT